MRSSVYITPPNWNLKSGPRNKSLATQHLEFIAYSLLSDDSDIQWGNNEDDEITLTINNKTFSLTKILKAKPDFDQLYFSPSQLNSYLKKFHGLGLNQEETTYSGLSLHPAERTAISEWTTNYYDMNALLRDYQYHLDDEGCLLLTICIASHGLSKPLDSASKTPIKTNRGELDGAYLEKRQIESNAKIISTHSGFTAASDGAPFPGIQMGIWQPASLNPLGKTIVEVSPMPDEKEVLFPPNSEFICEQQFDSKLQWRLWPCRSIHDTDMPYDHAFTQDQLYEIDFEKTQLSLNALSSVVDNHIKKHTRSTFGRFFYAAKNDQQLFCLQVIRDYLNHPDPLSLNKLNGLILQTEHSILHNKTLISNCFFKPSMSSNIHMVLNELLNTFINYRQKLYPPHINASVLGTPKEPENNFQKP